MTTNRRCYRGYRVTLYLTEAAKTQSYRMWCNLLALDFHIVAEHEKAGVIIGEWENEDTQILANVPGVATLQVAKIDSPPQTSPDAHQRTKTKRGRPSPSSSSSIRPLKIDVRQELTF